MNDQLLFVGDVHLGRRSSRVPRGLEREGLDAGKLSPRGAFEALIEEALRRRVLAVVFLGDVVDREQHYLEAWSLLETGVRRLVEAGITVAAVVGNHDVVALPRLAAELPDFKLIGQGEWQTLEFPRKKGPGVRLVGWSFPEAQVTRSPLSTLELAPKPELATIGLLHCDLDAASSVYAPVRRSELRSVPVDAWFLGHLHQPSLPASGTPQPIGYLGSLVGLDPTETGIHGPWLVTLVGGRELAWEQLPLAPLVWQSIEVDVAPLESAEELEPAVVRSLRERAEELKDQLGSATAVGCRVRLVGSSEHHRALREAFARLNERRGDLLPQLDGRTWFVDKFLDESTAAIDLVAIARGTDPPALFARQLLALRARDANGQALVRSAARRLATVDDRDPWNKFEFEALAEGDVRATLEDAAERALEALLAQQDQG